MPQLSLYLDEDTLKKIELAAKIDHTSISKWVSTKLKESLNNTWPVNYESLFGSINDDTFITHEINDYSIDSEREEIWNIIWIQIYVFIF